jgi:hypothetical protein
MDDFAKQMKDNLERAEANFRKLIEPPSLPEMERLDLADVLDPLKRYDAASDFINGLIENINEWRATLPQGARPSVNLVMPDGRYMLVDELHPLGFQGFAAHGYVDGAQCRINGHINTLVIIGVELSTSPEVGFAAKRAGTIEPPATPESQ